MENAPQIFLAEVFGTGALVLLGDAVVAGVLLNRSKAQNSGWIVITTAWAFAVFVGVIIAGPLSGAHLNPAVTLGLALNGAIGWDLAVVYWAAEMLGAFLGAVLVFLHYYPHWAETEDADLKLAVFCTGRRSVPPRGTSSQRAPGHVRADVRDLRLRPAEQPGPRKPRSVPSCVPGPCHWPRARWHDRLRDQPGS